MRRAVRPLDHQGSIRRQLPGDAVDIGDFDRLVEFHRRQDRGHGSRQQCLARAWRPDHQHVVGAGRGHFQRPLHVLLPAHVGEIHRVARLRHVDRRGRRGLDLEQARVMRDELLKRLDRVDIDAADDCRLGRVHGRHERLLHLVVACRRHHW